MLSSPGEDCELSSGKGEKLIFDMVGLTTAVKSEDSGSSEFGGTCEQSKITCELILV